MKPTNYCRAFVRDLSKVDLSSMSNDELVKLRRAAYFAENSVKFLLPEGGFCFIDMHLRGLNGVPLSLPFPIVALEFFRSPPSSSPPGEEYVFASKTIVFAAEADSELVISACLFLPEKDSWTMLPEFRIKKDECISDGLIRWNSSDGRSLDSVDSRALGVVLQFLNSLACANVGIERIPARIGAAKVKAALPFDDYHILTVDVPGRGGGSESAQGSREGRTPREHLRRGHIRRLADGRRLWINATIVAAGKGGGTLHKDYLLRPRGDA